jgi:hypothetical protein
VNYAKYIEAFNAGDDAALVQKFLTEDCVFHNAVVSLVGGVIRGFPSAVNDGTLRVFARGLSDTLWGRGKGYRLDLGLSRR